MIEILGLLLVAGVGWYVAWPLLTTPSGYHQVSNLNVGPDLEARRETLYREIADLDFDHSLGKIDDDDYRQEREAYVSEAAMVLADLDSAERDVIPNSNEMIDIDRELEEEILRLRSRRVL
jgi:hypothetical protein